MEITPDTLAHLGFPGATTVPDTEAVAIHDFTLKIHASFMVMLIDSSIGTLVTAWPGDNDDEDDILAELDLVDDLVDIIERQLPRPTRDSKLHLMWAGWVPVHQLP